MKKLNENKSKINLKISEKIPKKEKIGEGIVEEKNVFATYPYKCKECGYDKAEVMDAGVQYSDEDNLFLVKCGKCGNVERIGDAT
jgi:DNA-directed RNA polymerase subunit M/transcription elongation factor TFIIS